MSAEVVDGLYDAVEQLRGQLAGQVILPDDAEYEQARRVHNGLIDKRPALVARCQGLADVVAAVQFAGAHGLAVAIRGGGHSVAGHGTCDGEMVIDLSGMRAVHVDPKNRTARVQGGATLGDLDRDTQVFGLATPTGQVSNTGVAGLTLSGGMGMLQRKYGLTIDNLLSAEVVTADGSVVTASEDENPELFWALRGAGGNFGVVTSFEFRLHEVGPIAMGGLVAFPVEQTREVLEFLSDFIADAPEELSADAIFQFAPPLEVIPEEHRGTRLIGLFLRYVGPIDEGYEAVRPIQEFGEPVLNFFGPMPYTAVQALLDPLNPRGYLNYWTGEYVPTLDGDVIDVLEKYGSDLPAHQSVIQVIPFNAAPTRVPSDATAFSHRKDSWLIHVLGQWTEHEDSERVIAWVKGLGAELREFSNGEVYLNIVTDDEETDRVQAFWSDQRLERLAAVKAQYDPDNIFRFNHNIKPAPPAPGGSR